MWQVPAGRVVVVFSSSVFAILGLRPRYFLLGGAVEKFHLLRYGLAVVLVFVGLKMVWLDELYGGTFPILASLLSIVTVIGASIGASPAFPRSRARGPGPAPRRRRRAPARSSSEA